MFVCVWLEKSVQNNDFVSIRGYHPGFVRNRMGRKGPRTPVVTASVIADGTYNLMFNTMLTLVMTIFFSAVTISTSVVFMIWPKFVFIIAKAAPTLLMVIIFTALSSFNLLALWHLEQGERCVCVCVCVLVVRRVRCRWV